MRLFCISLAADALLLLLLRKKKKKRRRRPLNWFGSRIILTLTAEKRFLLFSSLSDAMRVSLRAWRGGKQYGSTAAYIKVKRRIKHGRIDGARNAEREYNHKTLGTRFFVFEFTVSRPAAVYCSLLLLLRIRRRRDRVWIVYNHKRREQRHSRLGCAVVLLF